jgi:hypothetical protein
MGARSFETSALTIPTRCRIPEYGILYSHRRENLKPRKEYVRFEVFMAVTMAVFWDVAMWLL